MLLIYAESIRTDSPAETVTAAQVKAWLDLHPKDERVARIEEQLRTAGHDIAPAQRPPRNGASLTAEPHRPGDDDSPAALWWDMTTWFNPDLERLAVPDWYVDSADFQWAPDLPYQLMEIHHVLQRTAEGPHTEVPAPA